MYYVFFHEYKWSFRMYKYLMVHFDVTAQVTATSVPALLCICNKVKLFKK